MVLVDTSVWVDHFRRDLASLRQLLNDSLVFCHPFVIGELACGHLKNRTEILSLLTSLPQSTLAQDEEAREFITRHKLMGRGLGWIDIHLLSSAALARTPLWTLDKNLRKAASALELAFTPS